MTGVYGRTFAEVYSRHWDVRIAEVRAQFDALSARFGLAPRSALDLACGTGGFAVGLARRGVRTVGIDRSPDMLAIARRRARRARVRVQWLELDMRAFVLEEPVDLVTCWFDSLNYLTEPGDVKATFRAVLQHLTPRGAFLFDVNTIRALRDQWGNNTMITVNEATCFVVLDAKYDAERHTNALIMHGFIKRRRGFERFTETHVERAYPLVEIEAWLAETGFEDVTLFARKDYTPATEEHYRVFAFARRPHA